MWSMQSTLMDLYGMSRTYQSKIVYWSLNRILIHQLRNNGIFAFVLFVHRCCHRRRPMPKNETHQLFLLLMFWPNPTEKLFFSSCTHTHTHTIFVRPIHVVIVWTTQICALCASVHMLNCLHCVTVRLDTIHPSAHCIWSYPIDEFRSYCINKLLIFHSAAATTTTKQISSHRRETDG